MCYSVSSSPIVVMLFAFVYYYTYGSIIRTVVRIVGMGRISHNYMQYKMFTFIKLQ